MSERSPIETLSQQRRQRLKRADIDRARHPAEPEGDDERGVDGTGGADSGSAGNGGGAGGQRTGNLVNGRFRLLSRLGSGRLGEIYEARIEDGLGTGLERLVALQIIDRSIGLNHALMDKLRRGYAALRAGPHPNIVVLEDLGRDGRSWYLVMERLEGVSLRFVLDDGGALPADEATAVIRSVGDALSYLHAKAMVHGAVTPGSVFVTEGYEVKLLDIVSALPPSALSSESGKGADAPLAPDQSDDVYGLACLTYELLSGRHPYNYATAAEARRLGIVPPAIAQMPRVRWQALARGLEPERGRRPSNVGVFLRDLGISGSERLIAPGQPPQPERERPAQRLETPRAVAAGDTSRFVATAEDRLAMTPLPRRPGRGRWVRRGLFLAVLGGLAAAAWVYREPIADAASARLVVAALDFVAGRGERSDGPPRAPGAVSGNPPTPTAGDTHSELVADAGGSDPAAAVGDADSEAATATATATAAAAGVAEPPPSGSESASGPGIDAAPPVAEGPERLVLENTVRGREGAGPVAVPVRREGDASSRTAIVWWTSDETALAGEDYADFGERSEEIAPGERDLTLHVPLVDDALPEPRESFLVNLGRRDPGSGSIDLIATTRVEIDDDDNSRR